MAYIATFDMGTTAVKAVLVSVDDDRIGRSEALDDDARMEIAASASITLPRSVEEDGWHEQDPEDWWHCFIEAWHALTDALDGMNAGKDATAGSVVGIILSGQMQDVITVDSQCRPVRKAILYSDGRAAHQAGLLAEAYGEDRFLDVVGNRCEGSLPLPKLMWLKELEPQAYADTAHVLFDAKDYIVARLTGSYIGDVTACSTAGAMNIRTRSWEKPLIAAAGIDIGIFPELHSPQDIVGRVSRSVSALTGFAQGTAVFAGIGDAGATTLASAVTKSGEYNINIGTSGWIAGVSEGPITDQPGLANLAYAMPEGYINGVPFLNAGGVHGWATRVFAAGVEDSNGDGRSSQQDFDRMSGLLERSVPGSHGVLCLPYLVGERFPVMNADIRGAYVGIGVNTDRADMARASLEGVAFSLRQGLECFDAKAEDITLVGGGAREGVWCQILADVLGSRIEVLDNAAVMPAVALSCLVLYTFHEEKRQENGAPVGEGIGRVLGRLRSQRHGSLYEAKAGAMKLYDAAYERFVRLYPSVNAMQ